MTTNTVYRPASVLESYHIARRNAKLDSCVVVAARFVRKTSSSVSADVSESEGADAHETNEKLSKEEVYAALVHALNTHAALSAKVVRRFNENQTSGGTGKKGSTKGKNDYVFERLENVNLEKVVHFLDNRDEEDIAALIQHQITEPIPSLYDFENDPENLKDVPLWRLTVTSRNMIIFAWHHGIGDGQSGLAFLRTILQGLNDSPRLQTDFNPRLVPTPADLKLETPMEELTDVSPSLRTLLSAPLGLFVPVSWSSARKTWTGSTIPSSPFPFLSRARALSIPPEQISRILSAARKNKSTLTAILYFLSVDVLSGLILKEEEKEKAGRRWKRLSISVPVSLRPITKVPLTAMTEQVSVHRSIQRLPPPNSPASSAQNSTFDADWWARTSAFSEALRISVPKTREVIGTIKYLSGKYESFFNGKLGKKRETSMEVSNLGAFKTDIEPSPSVPDDKSESKPDKKWAIAETYFGQDDVTGAALKVNVAGSPPPTNSVNIVVTWSKDVVDDVFAESFVGGLREALDRLSREVLKDEKSSA